jgi:mono/diheme cytochrome c family protein
VNRLVLIVATAAAALPALGCRGQTSEDPPVLLIRNMWAQERYNPQSLSHYFADHRTMRTPPEGTVPREDHRFLGVMSNGAAERELTGLDASPDGVAIRSGRLEDNSDYVPTIPQEIVQAYNGADAMLHRGQDRYNIYCSPCHGRTGDGMGIVVRRAAVTGYQFPQPPNFFDNSAMDRANGERLRHVPDGQLFATITNGVRNMPSYAAQIPIADRWAIVSYVRALQVSQITRPREGAQ